MRSNVTRNLGVITRAALAARGQLVEAPRVMKAPPISSEDERDLRKYFSEESRPGAASEASNFHQMIERMALYQRRAVPCRMCGGEPEVVAPDGTVIHEAKGGTGRVLDSKAYREWMRIGRGARLRRDREAVEAWLTRSGHTKVVQRRVADGREHRETVFDIDCPRCTRRGKNEVEGREYGMPGWLVRSRRKRKESDSPPTVAITAETPPTPSVTPNGGEELMVLARVGRRRAKMRATSPLAEAALEAWYSPDGRTLVALWHLTPAGRTMLRGNSRGATHQEYWSTTRIAQEKNQDPQVAQQFQAADEQARQLLEEMRWAWWETADR